MNIRLTEPKEFEKIRSFYHQMTDWFGTRPYGSGYYKFKGCAGHELFELPLRQDKIKNAQIRAFLYFCLNYSARVRPT